jgi:UDP-glucose 4-epimerase
MADCLVVGGGFIGAHTAEELAGDGHHVRVYSRSFNDWLVRSGAPPANVELIRGTIPDDGSLRDLVAEADVVLYLAGSSTPAASDADPGGSIDRSVVPATAVLDHMRATGTRRVVVASSGGTVYGEVQTVPTPEDHPTEPVNVHGVNALTIERYAAFFAERYGLEPIILRYSNPYGPGQPARRGQGVIAVWCGALARGEPLAVFGDTGARRDFIYIGDAADATARAAVNASPGVYNVGAGRSHSLGDVLETLTTVSGRQVQVERRESRAVDVRVTQLDCSRLIREIGWRPTTSISEGIASAWRWVTERTAADPSQAR